MPSSGVNHYLEIIAAVFFFSHRRNEGGASLTLAVSQGECEAVALWESIVLEIYIGSITLQLTTVKWPVLSSLSAMCIIQLTTQKAGVGSRTAISS